MNIHPILGVSNVHHKTRLNTDPEGRLTEAWIGVDIPTRFLIVTTLLQYSYYLALTTNFDSYYIDILTLLRNFNHALLEAEYLIQLEVIEVLPSRPIWHYKTNNSESLRDYFSTSLLDTKRFSNRQIWIQNSR